MMSNMLFLTIVACVFYVVNSKIKIIIRDCEPNINQRAITITVRYVQFMGRYLIHKLILFYEYEHENSPPLKNYTTSQE